MYCYEPIVHIKGYYVAKNYLGQGENSEGVACFKDVPNKRVMRVASSCWDLRLYVFVYVCMWCVWCVYMCRSVCVFVFVFLCASIKHVYAIEFVFILHACMRMCPWMSLCVHKSSFLYVIFKSTLLPHFRISANKLPFQLRTIQCMHSSIACPKLCLSCCFPSHALPPWCNNSALVVIFVRLRHAA